MAVSTDQQQFDTGVSIYTDGTMYLDGASAEIQLNGENILPVAGNPTVPSGTTPTSLSGLKVGSTYYSISGGGGGGSSLTADGTTIVNNNGTISTAVGGYSEVVVPSATVDGSHFSNISGYYTNKGTSDAADAYNLANSFAVNDSITVNISFTVTNNGNDVVNNLTNLTFTKDYSGEYKYNNSVSITGGDNVTYTSSAIRFVGGTDAEMVFNGMSSFVSAGNSFTGDVTISGITSATVYHKINRNYLDIPDYSQSLSTKKVVGPNDWNYLDCGINSNGYGVRFKAKYADVYIGITDISADGINIKGLLKADAASTSIDIVDLIARNPAPSSTQGTYVLKCVVDANGDPTYSWVAES